MPVPTPRAARLVLPLVLVAVGLIGWALARSSTATGGHAYSTGGTSPSAVELTAGHTYSLAVVGGLPELHRRGLVASRLACTTTGAGGFRTKLALQAEASDTKAINEFASFVAGTSGPVTVACNGLAVGRVFVDNADDAPADRSGELLLAAVVALVPGLALLLSALRTNRRTPAPAAID